MKKFMITALIIGILLVVEFFVGFEFGRGSDIVTVKIENRSNYTIKNATIEFQNGSVFVNDVEKGKTRVTRYFADKKDIYRLKVKLGNNKLLFSESRYVTPGSLLVEKVTDSLIVGKR